MEEKNTDLNKNNYKVIDYLIKNKKTAIITIIILIAIILIVSILCNKTEIGNTSGNLNNLGFSVKKNGWIYYLGLKDNNTDGIYRAKLNGEKQEKVTTDYGVSLNKSGKFIYYLDMSSDEYSIAKIKTNGDGKETVIKGVDQGKITVIGDWIYYFKESNFYKAKTNGEDKQILSKKTITNYEVVDNWIYYSYNDEGKTTIAKMKTNGEDITKIDNDASKEFFVNKGKLYYIYEKYDEENFEYNYVIYQVKTNGKDKKEIASIGKNIEIENVNFDGNRLYYIKSNDNNVVSIYSIKLNGKDERKIVDIKGNYTMMNIHKGWIYYTDQNDNGDSQMFIVKTNGEKQRAL